MGATFSRTKIWIDEILTSSDLNAEFDGILSNLTPAGVDDESANATAMQATADPYPAAEVSLATSLQGEIQRLRYMIKQITGKTYWYQDPDATLATLAVRDKHRGLVIKRNSMTPASQIDINADEIILENASGVPMRVTSLAVTGDITVSGANGLDTGVEENVWYYLWVIHNGTDPAALISASATAPTLPRGYTHKALVGMAHNTDGDFVDFVQVGNTYKYVAPVTVLASGAATSLTTMGDLTAYLPAVKMEEVFGNYLINGGPLVAAISADATNNQTLFSEVAVGHQGSWTLRALENQTLYYAVSANSIDVRVCGWRLP